jgi:hypothetical protein
MELARLVELIDRQEIWEDKLHKEEETITDQLGLTKYKCPCTMCFGVGRPILRSTIRWFFKKIGRHYLYTKPLMVWSFYSKVNRWCKS